MNDSNDTPENNHAFRQIFICSIIGAAIGAAFAMAF
jgi:hypothetical protein